MDEIMIIIPSLNPDKALTEVVDGLLEAGIHNILVINDGSAAEYLEPFKYAEKRGCEVISHEVNKGKGQALRTAFSYIKTNYPGIKAVITVDGDNQHRVEDIIKCAELYREKPDNVILGCRDFSGKDVPARSRFGNNMTRMVFQVACGIKISDTQTGLRCIPAEYLGEMLSIPGDRYEYETNMLLHMKEQGIPFDEVKINTVYIEDNSSSHFNPIRDSIRIYGVILKFFISSIWSAVIDILIFAIMCNILACFMERNMYILLSTITARVISSLCNYAINHKIVFKSKGTMKQTIIRYYILCVCQMMVSYGIVALVSGVINAGKSLVVVLKLITDVILFFISFRIQKQWVFNNSK